MRKATKAARVLRMIVLDVLLAGLILLCFAFFHHVLPALRSSKVQAPVVTAAPTATPQPMPTEAVIADEQPVEEMEDTRTPWQKKFADKFSDTVIVTENSYKSPTVSIEVETVSTGEGKDKITYHVADIYIASIENFATYTANNEIVHYGNQDVEEMDRDCNALLSMTGDFLTYQQTGLLVRNGEVYKADQAYCDICVMYYDGTVETFRSSEYDREEILAKQPYQIWNFGPELIDENGGVPKHYNVSNIVGYRNPRSAFGYYEPGHYCFVVVDGRQEGYSKGMVLPELAQLFVDLGCTAAYNMDGGGSAIMLFNHERVSQMSNGGDRNLGDILIIRETEAAE